MQIMDSNSKTAVSAEPVDSSLANVAVLSVKGLGKEYRLYDSPRARLKSLLFGGHHYRSHRVLQDVSFELFKGQCLGVVGNNGAGKSSLLKLIAGTLQPSSGVLHRAGRVTAILELGAGFHPDFTGRENLYFGGRLIGISEADIQNLAQSIIDFSELDEAIDRPVKSYSSGMVVRLAFALVTAVEPEVLIIDEALAVGDQHFQRKCIERIDAFRRNGCTILFCSHSLYHIRRLCDRAIWLEKGQVRAFGPTEDVLASYEADLPKGTVKSEKGGPVVGMAEQMAALEHAEAGQPTGAADALQEASGEPLLEGHRGKLLSLEIADLGEGEIPLLESTDLCVTVKARTAPGEVPHFGVMLEQARGAGITIVGTQNDGLKPERLSEGLWQVRLRFPDLPLFSGDYVVSAFLFDTSGLVVYDEWLHHSYFKIRYEYSFPGLVRLPHVWEHARNAEDASA